VHFGFERYKGAGAKLLKSKVKPVEIVNPHHKWLRCRGMQH
jgi:hypothetical protein